MAKHADFCDTYQHNPRVNAKEGYVELRWYIDDIDAYCEDKGIEFVPALTREEKMNVLDFIERHHYAEQGVSWSTIGSALDTLYGDRCTEVIPW